MIASFFDKSDPIGQKNTVELLLVLSELSVKRTTSERTIHVVSHYI